MADSHPDAPSAQGAAPTDAEVTVAADAADAFLGISAARVVRDPTDVWYDDQSLVFVRRPGQIDDRALVVDRATLTPRLVTCPPWKPSPFAHMKRVLEADEGPLDPSTPLVILLPDDPLG